VKYLLPLAVLGFAFTALSPAATITYTDSAVLSCGANASCSAGPSNTLTFLSSILGGPSLTVAYNAGGDNQIAPPPVSANFGSIVLTCAGCTLANTAAWDLGGASGIVTFNQTQPFVGSNTLSGTFSSTSLGWAGAQQGQARFLFSPSAMQINGGSNETVTYTVDQPLSGVLLQLGSNSVQGLLNYSQTPATPEPSTLSMLGIGLAAAAWLRRRA
jgi:hypothetical protein